MVTRRARRRAKRGQGSIRSRRPGTWEIRITVGSGHEAGRQRSFTHHGDEASARCRKADLLQLYGKRRTILLGPVPTTVGALLDRFLEAPHVWSPTTRRRIEGQAARLRTDAVYRMSLSAAGPASMERMIGRWMREDLTPANFGRRYSLLHSAFAWAIEHRLLEDNPLADISGPSQPPPRQHLRPGEVKRLILTADELVEEAAARVAELPGQRAAIKSLFLAEQNALLVRVTADAGLARGELCALKTTSLQGRVLRITHTSQDGQIVEVKDHRRNGLTVSQSTARYWAEYVQRWHGDPDGGSWLFVSTRGGQDPIKPNGLGQRFEKIALAAELPGAALHRIRHTIGTYLVSQGKIVQASKRLRYRDVATTLRTYRHALPLDDEDVSDTVARLFGFDELLEM